MRGRKHEMQSKKTPHINTGLCLALCQIHVIYPLIYRRKTCLWSEMTRLCHSSSPKNHPKFHEFPQFFAYMKLNILSFFNNKEFSCLLVLNHFNPSLPVHWSCKTNLGLRFHLCCVTWLPFDYPAHRNVSVCEWMKKYFFGINLS